MLDNVTTTARAMVTAHSDAKSTERAHFLALAACTDPDAVVTNALAEVEGFGVFGKVQEDTINARRRAAKWYADHKEWEGSPLALGKAINSARGGRKVSSKVIDATLSKCDDDPIKAIAALGRKKDNGEESRVTTADMLTVALEALTAVVQIGPRDTVARETFAQIRAELERIAAASVKAPAAAGK